MESQQYYDIRTYSNIAVNYKVIGLPYWHREQHNFIAMKNISVLDGDAIRKNPLNNSPSKQGYSFSKQERFRLPPAKYQHFYEVARPHSTNTMVDCPKELPVWDMEIALISPRLLPLVPPAPNTILKLLCSAPKDQKREKHLESADK